MECGHSRILWLLTHRPRLVEQLLSETLLVLRKREGYNTQLKCHTTKDNIKRIRDGNGLTGRDISRVKNNKIYPGLWRGFNPWFRKIPWGRKWQPAPIFSPEKSHAQRSLVGYSLWDRKSQTWLNDWVLVPEEPLPSRHSRGRNTIALHKGFSL